MASRAILSNFLEKYSELKTTHKTFRGCRVHFIRQHFSKQLYTVVTMVAVPSVFHTHLKSDAISGPNSCCGQFWTN